MASLEGLREFFLICREKEQWGREGRSLFPLSLPGVVVVGVRLEGIYGPGFAKKIVFTSSKCSLSC